MNPIMFVTNIPTPYRSFFYNKLAEKLNIEVLFMDQSEPDRKWIFDSNEIHYKHRFFKNIGVTIKNIKFHLNPQLIFYIYKNSPPIVIIAGSWNFPTNMLLMLLRGIFKNTKFGFWNEGNLIEEKYSRNIFIKTLKKYMYNKFDFFCSSGILSDDLINHYCYKPTIIRLSNIINDDKFKYRGYDSFNCIDIFIIARLNEVKNIYPYIKACVDILKTKNIRFLIAGDGPEKNKIQSLISDNKLESKVILLGYLEENKIINYLRSSQIFCLPSATESFPLSVIEAMFSSKPLLLSNTIGSTPECLKQDVNGISFDPVNPSDMAYQTEKITSYSHQKLMEMGTNSYNLAEKTFDSSYVIENYVKSLSTITTS